METQNATIVIKITGSDTSTGDLTLSDKGYSELKPGVKVRWNVHPKSGVEEIIDITVKTNFVNVFSSGPSRVGNSKNWQGKTMSWIKEITDEDYNIEWKGDDGKTYTYDPRLRVNPSL